MKRQHQDAAFEPRQNCDGRTWGIEVMWQHSLRNCIAGLAFPSEKKALYWIETQSRKWLEAENRRPATRSLSLTHKFALKKAAREGPSEIVDMTKKMVQRSPRNPEIKTATPIAAKARMTGG